MRIVFELSTSANGYTPLADAYLAVHAWAFATANSAELVWRLHDDNGAIQSIIDEFIQIGLNWTAGPDDDFDSAAIDESDELSPCLTSLRTGFYTKTLADLAKRGLTTQNDVLQLISGSIDLTDLHGRPLPVLRNVVDDHYMQVTHTAMTHSAIANDYKASYQAICNALGWQPPLFLDIPPFDADRSAPSVGALIEEGHLPAAIRAYLLSQLWVPDISWPKVTIYTVRRHYQADQADTVAFDLSRLQTINHAFIVALPAADIAEHIRPNLQDWYGPLPSTSSWLERLAAVIQPELYVFSEAADIAGWAFDEGYDLNAKAAPYLEDESASPILVQLVAELSHIVLLDQQTAATILSGMQERFPPQQVTAVVAAALIGRITDQISLPDVMAILGKTRCQERFSASLQ